MNKKSFNLIGFLQKHKIKIIVLAVVLCFLILTIDMIPSWDSYKELDMSTPADGLNRIQRQIYQIINPLKEMIKRMLGFVKSTI